ncbi:Protein GrpE [Aquicella lusitana]|uniref:Protein GrpE n=2 Tax=Aquicella lusitana TaxID=254246 RepID=A0A370GZE9_9COXI|nr:molecular chaperone GrpE [Aquicella lusitana]VVC72939.1 Protein GrpE [Aquicella lusitana]
MKKNTPDHDAENESNSDKSKLTELLEHPSYQELMQKLDEAEKKASENWERALRLQADSENAMRRAERDVANAHKYALEKFVAELLPIVDSLELCISNVPNEMQEAAGSVIEGVRLTLKMFYTAFEKFGIKQVNPLSEPFDPEFQQAISMQETDTAKPGTVISVLQKGYTLNNRLIRPALVTVAKGKE